MEQVHALLDLVVDLLSGHVLAGRYALERLVRSDAHGALYEAMDLEQRANVAVRVVHGLWPAGSQGARPPSPHPHAAEIYAVGVTEIGLPYAVMQPLTGEVVADRLERGRAISRREALDWSQAVAEALADAHGHGELHGELSASSLFLQRADTAEQSLLVLGFELYELTPPASPPRSGVPAVYRAPELVAGGRPTAASDIYAFAILLGQLFSPQAPPAAADPAIVRDWLLADLPGELAPLASRAVAPGPPMRPSASAFAGVIARIERGCV